MFFSFVVNTGLLIAAKISLQTAADAAAYAGAATQARELNAISYLNYDMKRQFKKFAYRYTFVGNIGNDGFPGPPTVGLVSGAATTKAGYYTFWKHDSSQTTATSKFLANPMNVPVVCIPLTTNGQANDNCLQINIPNNAATLTKMFPSGGLTAITQQLLDNVIQIQNIQNNLCQGQSDMNLFVLLKWLFRGASGNNDVNQDLQTFFNTVLTSTMSQSDKDGAMNTIKNLVKGLGLYPRNMINSMRIETLEQFLNAMPQPSVTQDLVTGWEASPQAEGYERTILAFKSALSNLNNDVMAHSDVTMIELQSPHQIQLAPVTTNFNAYVQIMAAQNNPPSSTTSATVCNASIVPFPALDAPLGYIRTDGGVVHYAVKIKAKARLLFLPLKDGIDLEAVAGAKPFGSRIGPANLSPNDFVEAISNVGVISTQAINDGSGPAGYNVPNIKISGMSTFFQQTYLAELNNIATGNQPGHFTMDGMLLAQDSATAPNPYDVGHYNIIPPTKSEADMKTEFIRYATRSSPSDKTSASANPTVYRFYAPLYQNGNGSFKTKAAAFIEKMFPTGFSSGSNPFGLDYVKVKAVLIQELNDYDSALQSNLQLTENQESETFAAVELPIQKEVLPSGNRSWLTTADEVLSSWGPDNVRGDGGAYGLHPRFGYSVKFVTMQNLIKAGMPGDEDLQKVSH